MAEITIHVPNTLLRRLPKNQEEVKEVVKPDPKRFAARRHQKARSIVDATFAALPVKKHARIEELIEQTKYGE